MRIKVQNGDLMTEMRRLWRLLRFILLGAPDWLIDKEAGLILRMTESAADVDAESSAETDPPKSEE